MSFELSWAKLHPGRAPVGWLLRTGGCPNWIRFHSLAGSKRYADSIAERVTLLARQNKLASTVLGDQPCWLVQARWPVDPEGRKPATAQDPFGVSHDWRLQPSFAFTMEDDDRGEWRAWAARVDWKPGAFDGLLLSIAEDQAAPTLWMAYDGSIIAPYDGGVDVFTSTGLQRDRLASRYADWLSRHPEGL